MTSAPEPKPCDGDPFLTEAMVKRRSEARPDILGVGASFRDVTRSFGSLRAVDRLSMDIEAGEFFTILGASGSGKTTVLQLLAGFQGPDSGRILFDGKDISGVPPFKRAIGVVFQSYALFPHLGVAENVAFPLRVRKLSEKAIRPAVHDALKLVGLSDLGGRKISELSGGQQQRVALARAIVYRPPLLLMDEPLSALDAKLRLTMQAELKAIHRELGVTIVYVTHDQREALSMSDRIAVLRRGRVEQIAEPAVLYERPSTPYVADFIGEANVLAASVLTVKENELQLSVAGNTLRAPTPRALHPSRKVWLVVRPERVQIGANIDGAGGISGRVLNIIYAGDHTVAHVEIAESVIVRSRVAATNVFPLSIGDLVSIRWDPRHSIVLQEQ